MSQEEDIPNKSAERETPKMENVEKKSTGDSQQLEEEKEEEKEEEEEEEGEKEGHTDVQPVITNNEPTTNMEVHHHPQVKKKNFKEYFLEFLMIFLAVTMGFFAEGLREHIGDKNKEKEYLSSMISELQYDRTKYKEVTNTVIYLRPLLDSLYLNAKEAKRFNYVLQGRWNTPINETSITYQPSLVTIEQLKSSGNLRLIEDKMIANKIVGYATFVNNNVLQTRVTDMTEATNNVYAQEDAISDEEDFNRKLDENIAQKRMPENSALFDMRLLVRDSVTLNRLANSFINLKARNYGYSNVINKADSLAAELIQLINDKYHFTGE
jgi:hypothetical protein